MSRALFAVVPACSLLSLPMVAHAAVEQPVSVKITAGELRGTLMLPSQGNSKTVALIIAGSGPTDRDGNNPLAKNDSLKMLANVLAEAGVASVRYDKRGIGDSAAAATDESKLVFQDFVADAKAWLDLLVADRRFDAVVVIGHSEGATIGLLASLRSKVVAYVSIAGPAKRAQQVLRAQLQGKLPASLAATNEQILVELENGRQVKDVPPPLLSLYRPSVQPCLIDWFKVVPTDEIRKLRMPCLIAQGDTDLQVLVDDAKELHAANPQAQLAIISGMNHVLKLVPNDQARQLASYRDASLPLAPALGDHIVQFLRTL